MDLMDKGIRVAVDGQGHVQARLNGQRGPWNEYHGETGTTYGGSGYSPLVRSIHFPAYGNVRTNFNKQGHHVRTGKNEHTGRHKHEVIRPDGRRA